MAKSENTKAMIEKQNKELKDKVVELEELAKGRSKAVITNLEAKIAAVEEQLHLEANEKQRLSRELRKSDRKLRDTQTQIEEERKQAESYKEQVISSISKILYETVATLVIFLNKARTNAK